MTKTSPRCVPLLLLAILLLTACGGAATAEPPEAAPAEGAGASGGPQLIESPPPVPGAESARQHGPVALTYYGDSVGLGAQMDQSLARRFGQDTGITVKVLRKPQDATEAYATYQRFFQAQSPDIDVLMLDVIWPGAFAQHLLDLAPALGEQAKQHYPSLIQNNTIAGRLVAMPWFSDVGMLYYRSDLLEKYGFDAPPRTWDELEQQARTIMAGERQAGSPQFTGFVWQGSAYEGLTCNALEWLASSGGGTLLDQSGAVSVDNPAAARALERAHGWVGTISPRGVTSYTEEDSRNIFQGGNAAFMRNWPYVYAAANQEGSPIKGKFDVAPLPAEPGQPHVGAVGGWQLGVSAYSRNPEAATEFVRYMTSPEVQKWRAIVSAASPTIESVASDPQVLEVLPFLAKLSDVNRVTRPSGPAGSDYNQVSTTFFQGTYLVLQGRDAAQVLPQVKQRIGRVMRKGAEARG